MAEDLARKMSSVVRGFEEVAADGGVGAAEVSRFPRFVE